MSSDEELDSKIPTTQIKFINTDLNRDKDKLVFHYFADNLSEDEINNAYIILFAGKTGSGKTTAINAIVNIIKGIKLGDPKRYKLIEEKPKATGQAESQTDGIHLYYLKDYENNPLIIIDSQGYGDTRGHTKDLEINKAFEYVFSHIIDHINIVCLTMSSKENRLDPLTKYIYSSVTSLFADDISDNFIVLATNADVHKLKKPNIIESILTSDDAKFLQIKNEVNKRWWYTFDSLNIFDNDEGTLTKHSFKYLQKFYEDTVKKSEPKDIKKSAEILKERNKLLDDAKVIENQCEKIISEQEELEKEEKNIQAKKKESEELKNKEAEYYKKLKESPKEEQIKLIKEKEIQNKNEIARLRNETTDDSRWELISTSDLNTHCDFQTCHSNCHLNCDCYKSFESCKTYNWSGWKTKTNTCKNKNCGHQKKNHTKEHKKWDFINKKKQVYSEEEIKSKIDAMNKDIELQKSYIKNLENSEKKTNQDLEKNSEKIKNCENEIREYKKKIDCIKVNIKDSQKELLLNLAELHKINEKIKKFALNKTHTKAQEDYIKTLKAQLNPDERKKIKKLNDIQKLNNLFMESENINLNDLENLSADELAKKINDFFTIKEKKEK